MSFEKIIEILIDSPEMLGELLPPIVEKYKQPLYVICGEILKIVEDYSNADAYFNTIARIKRKQFDAYINVGFTEKEAMTFMLNQDSKIMKAIQDVGMKFKQSE